MIDHELHNCGECRVQNAYRVSLRKLCLMHDISPGDIIEVFVKIVPAQEKRAPEEI